MRRVSTRSTLGILVFAVLVGFSGCIGGVADGGDAETPEPSPEPTPTPTETEPATHTSCSMNAAGTTGSTPTPTEENSPTPADRDVTVASDFARVQAGDSTQFTYRGERISLSYTKSDDTSRIEVETEANRKVITRDRDDSARTLSWSWDGVRFVLRPVEAEQRDGQTVYVFGETWDTSHVELEVYCNADC